MTPSEFAFMSLGMLLGILSGAALVEILRSRPPAPREIRLTVTPDSIPRRRAATLAEDAFVMRGAEPAFGGPADRRRMERRGLQAALARTDVRSPLGPAGAGDPTSSRPLTRLFRGRSPSALLGPGSNPLLPRAIAPGIAGGAIAIPIYRETDWTLAALRNSAARTAEQAMRDQRLTSSAILDRPAPGEGLLTDPAGLAPPSMVEASANGWTPEPSPPDPGTGAATGAGAGSGADPGAQPEKPADGCGEARRVADERCAVATRARDQAETARGALRSAQRAYDDHHTRAEQANAAADPRAIRVAKETAQQLFRDHRGGAGTREEVETAARDWLTEINQINRAAREASASTQREREAANALVMTIERLHVEADAARISSEVAEAACIAARQAVADCQEAAAADRAATAWPAAPSAGQGGGRPGIVDDESELEAAFTATGAGEPAILRLLRGDRAALGRVVAELAGDDPAERRRWQLAIANLVDSIVARSIEASSLTFPLEHSFWGNFTLEQNREIVAALSSLGYRFDGLGGWTDERVPSQRDLSLAVGYAGLDPMRIRPWPSEVEMQDLFREVAVAADEYLAEAAGGLTLGELVGLLGRRADGLADLWNEWGRVRPLLLAGG